MSDKFLFSLNSALAKACLKLQGNASSEDYATEYHECFQNHLQTLTLDLVMAHKSFQQFHQEASEEKLPSVSTLFAEDE